VRKNLHMANPPDGLRLHWITRPDKVTSKRLSQIARCWRDVSNDGGAVGFPFPPVEIDEVTEATKEMVASLGPLHRRLLIAMMDNDLAGWLMVSGNDAPQTSHWAVVRRVQTNLAFRGLGIGRALMKEASRSAAQDLGLDSLHIEVRGGEGLEDFYQSLGWIEIGRWPASLRFGIDDYRDSVLMALSLGDKSGRFQIAGGLSTADRRPVEIGQVLRKHVSDDTKVPKDL
jgi:GNAT superfamily N-acetyltransferase